MDRCRLLLLDSDGDCLCGGEGLPNGGRAEILYSKLVAGMESVYLAGREGTGIGFGHGIMSASNGHSGP
jgi:hypothetical protein